MTQEEDVKPKLNINVIYEGHSVSVKVKPITPFSKVFEAAEKRFGIQAGTFKFTFEGNRVRPEETPLDHDMEDGDNIDAHLEQVCH
ncbi:ubiquitin-like protein [Trametopsis cervina]|nr:ubiquitin-like protein [Trametopsis cervina]